MNTVIATLLRYAFGKQAADRYLSQYYQDGADLPQTAVSDWITEPVDRRDLPADHSPVYCWCIDAGHGPLTAGKRSPLLPKSFTMDGQVYDRLMEYAYNRDIADRVCEMLSALGLAYMRTMPADGIYGNALYERVSNANKHVTPYPKRFVSLHGNAAAARGMEYYCDDTARGVDTFYAKGSVPGYRMAYKMQTHRVNALREAVRGVYVDATYGGFYKPSLIPADVKDRGVKAANFYVLRRTTMPAVLLETFFFNNRLDVQLMQMEEIRQATAEAIIDAIIEIETDAESPAK